ncbi:Ethanolamine ammonia-lyase light chain [Filimonas lacunae]|uniref:Ethanolamine ammonia-lyase small subunit n=1 Tax=Filimonas lacunae TaxID=477680 RepID=A0A173MG05_9BACT|nr:ethanolamine ammonia-lyase subunit EutC [Filimonas lacunae]BAV06361.1 ethanolamine ammonia-lyase light chain [Filimonas lacunae]SIT26619.1 Ethanolamine ammonia-lyase light chain [Filimonas lacunae]
MEKYTQPIWEDAWTALRAYTNARIALGRTGTAIPLKENLSFRLAHAHARDAVYAALDIENLKEALDVLSLPVVELQSQAMQRQQYLQRPDLGRKLSADSVGSLQQQANSPAHIAIILADGLSALAVQAHASKLLQQLVPLLQASGFSFTSIAIVQQARVAIGDETAALLQAQLSLMLIGERPGLSSADSLGAYITFAPRPGLTDESRNCVSNIRPEGLPYQQAAFRIHYLIQQAFALQLSGVQLKDDSLSQLPGT